MSREDQPPGHPFFRRRNGLKTTNSTGTRNRDGGSHSYSNYNVYVGSQSFGCARGFCLHRIIDVTETGAPTVGDFTLRIRCTDRAGTTTYELDAVTAITSQTNGGQTIFTWGSGNAATLSGNGTLGSNLDVLKVFDFMEIELEVTTANDGTTSTADVTLLLEEV